MHLCDRLQCDIERGGPRRAAAVIRVAAALLSLVLEVDLAAAEEWVPVREVSLVVPEGSPLDFSSLVPAEPAGASGRVIASPAGRLVLEKSPDTPARFHCASLAWSVGSGSYPDRETADTYARQLRMHGYNLARFHFVDLNLMTDRDGDFDFDPVRLDRFRYLLAALKRNGIYWMIDVLTSENGAFGGIYPDRWEPRHELKLDVHISDAARKHWTRLLEAVLASTNPHTGLSPLQDPALAIVTVLNEGGLEYVTESMEGRSGRAYPAKLQAPFNEWLAATYGTTKALAAAWGGGALGRGESLEKRSIRLPQSRRDRGARMRDLQRFFVDREAGTFAFMSGELRRLGYEGLATTYNNWDTTAAHLSRRALPLVSIDSYFDHVSSLATGVSISQQSSLDDGAGYVQAMMGARWHGRPFVVAEHDHLFWNAYRHESGVVVPAYAALQGWDGVCRHGWGAIDLSYDQPWPLKQRMLPYSPGMDPIARASETLAALLFLRGDVSPARGMLTIPFAGAEEWIEDGQGQLPRDLTQLGLLTGIGLGTRADIEQGGAGADELAGPPTRAGLPHWLERAVDGLTGAGAARFEERLDRLVASGLLSFEVSAKAKQRIYQSDTGEILLDAPRQRIQVVTPRTEAVTFAAVPDPVRLGRLTVETASGPAMLAVSALDGETLAKSRRILVIFATDAMNTDMTFADPFRRTVADYGRLPVVMRRETVKLALELDPLPDRPRERTLVTSLRLDGMPVASLPYALDDGRLVLDLDTLVPEHGPTTFFLIER